MKTLSERFYQVSIERIRDLERQIYLNSFYYFNLPYDLKVIKLQYLNLTILQEYHSKFR